jgi:hypothetical protein
MKKQYPCKGRESRLPPNSGAQCAVCGAQAFCRLDIEFTAFRGDDEVYKLCRKCRELPAADIERLLIPKPPQGPGIWP